MDKEKDVRGGKVRVGRRLRERKEEGGESRKEAERKERRRR